MQATTWPEILELALRSGKEGAPGLFLRFGTRAHSLDYAKLC